MFISPSTTEDGKAALCTRSRHCLSTGAQSTAQPLRTSAGAECPKKQAERSLPADPVGSCQAGSSVLPAVTRASFVATSATMVAIGLP